jgi:hypothetical protein
LNIAPDILLRIELEDTTLLRIELETKEDISSTFIYKAVCKLNEYPVIKDVGEDVRRYHKSIQIILDTTESFDSRNSQSTVNKTKEE